jgi:hypothetical protein
MAKISKIEQKKVTPQKTADDSTGEAKVAKPKRRSKPRPSGAVAAKRIREHDPSKMPIRFQTFSKRARLVTDKVISEMFSGEIEGKVHFGDVFMNCFHQLVCKMHIKETALAKQFTEHADRKIYGVRDYQRFQVIRGGLE